MELLEAAFKARARDEMAVKLSVEALRESTLHEFLPRAYLGGSARLGERSPLQFLRLLETPN